MASINNNSWLLRVRGCCLPGKFQTLQMATLAFWVLAAGGALAAVAPGPDAYGYTVAKTSSFSFTNISSGSQQALFGIDDQAVTVNLGFAFRFYGVNYTNVSFSDNGFMTFGGKSTAFSNVNLTITATGSNLPSIAVLWDDWETESLQADRLYYRTSGTVGSRQFIVQWNQVVPVAGDGTDTMTFQARLFERSDNIVFSYFDAVVTDETTLPPNAASKGVGATVGIRDTSGQSNNRNLQWSYNQAVITNGLNLLFTHPNHAPVANNQSVTPPEDTATNLVLTASDAESTNLVLALLNNPTNGTLGTLNTNTGAVTYTPGTNYFGPDSFTFTVFDGSLYATGLVAITVTPVNDVPIAFSQSLTNAEDTALAVTLTSFDVDGPVTNFVLVTLPTHGTLTGSGANQVYTSATNYFGMDSFTFTVNDGSLTSAVATVLITVTPVNDPPVAQDDAYGLFKNTTLNVPASGVLANDWDADGDTLTAQLAATTTHGLLALNLNGGFTYTPSNNYVGSDSFTYRANDGTTNSDLATVTLTIQNTNTAPVAVNDSYTTEEDILLSVPASGVLANDTDIDGNTLSATLVTTTTNGVLTLNLNGSFTYQPNTNFNGGDSFIYRAHDGFTNSGLATVTITVTPVNDAPVVNNQSVTTPEDTATNLVLTASDVDSTNLVFALLSAPTNGTVGTLNTNTGAVTYTPGTNYFGPDSFTFTVFDGSLYATGLVAITVTPVNDVPIAFSQSLTNAEDTALAVTLTSFDVDGPVTNFVLVGLPTYGTLTGLGANRVYTPATNYFGLDSFTFTVDDGALTSAVATVSLTITPVNDLPSISQIPNLISYANTATGPIVFTVGDVETPAGSLMLSASSTNTLLLPTNNIVFGGSNSSRTVTLTPASNQAGTTLITVTVRDGDDGTASSSFLLTVWPPVTITSVTPQSGGGMVIQFSGVPGQDYGIEASTNLTSWINLGSASEGGPGAFQFFDVGTAGWPARFYRVRLP